MDEIISLIVIAAIVLFVFPVAALIVAITARRETRQLAARVTALEADAAQTLRTAQRVAATPPPVTATTPVTPPPPPKPADVAPAMPAAAARAAVSSPPLPPPPPPPPPPIAASTPATPGPSFEERLGTRWVVWLGGLTLALGGLFMVRYSIEQGLLGPAARVTLGGLFAAALIAAGEWMRRRDNLPQMPWSQVANIPAILTAAGTAVAFATVYASYALYEFLAPASAFLGLGIVAMLTLAAALLHGPALAGLGVAGAFVTPMLVSSDRPAFWALYLYIAVVTAAAFGLARIRLWRWLAVTTMAFALFWALAGLPSIDASIHALNFHVVAGLVLAALLVVCGFMFGPEGEPGKIEPISSLSLSVYLFASMLAVLASLHADSALLTFSALVLATLAIAWRAEAATAAVAAAAGLVFIVFAQWAVSANPDLLTITGGAISGVGPAPRAESITLHLVSALGFAAAFGAAGFFAQGRSTHAAVPVIWAAAGVFLPLALLVALYSRIAHFDRSIPFAIAAVVLAAAFGWATEWLSKREARPGLPTSVALFATGTLAAVALAFTFALERGFLTIALALTSLGAAWISLQRPIPFLRWLAAILATLVTLRIGWEPRIAGDNVGTTPIFNWLLYGYGIPALSFWAGAYFLRKRADDTPARMIDAAAILFTVLLAFMEIRHWINAGQVYRPFAGATEIGLNVCVLFAMAIGLTRLHERSGSIVHKSGALILGVIGLIASFGGLLLLRFPLFLSGNFTAPIFNFLFLAYALPAVMAALLAWTLESRGPRAYANIVAGAALALALAFVTLEVRSVFHAGPDAPRGVSDAEQYSYSIAWLVFGVILLGAGIWRNSQRARLASSVVIGLTILKVFLVDMSALTGVWRALSFMGLGLVLVAIGLFYQRILFRPAGASPPAPPPPAQNESPA